jgi:arylsulfatase A-like enzyme
MSVSGSGSQAKSNTSGWMPSLFAFWRREFGRTEPTRVGDLVVFPLAISATVGLISGIAFAAYRHFLDPAFIAYSIGVDIGIQIVILLLALALAFITRRKVWSGVLFAIGFFCFLALPGMVKLVLPGVAHPLAWCIALLGAFQIVRTVNRHRHSLIAVWMIAAPALVTLFALSYDPARELSMRSALQNPPNSPNVLFIIVDTLRADHLSPYGYTRDTSPYLTHLAEQGVLFENAIAPASWTLPSHASMLTGLYPHEDRVETEKDFLSGSFPTLGDAMAKRGYRTAAFSANYPLFSKDYGFIHGFSRFDDYDLSLSSILDKVPFSEFILKDLSHITSGQEHAFFGRKNAPDAENITEDALNWIAKGRRPFFVVLNYYDLHEPVLPPQPYLHMYTTNAKARSQSLYFPDGCTESPEGESCQSERPQYVDVYDGAIRYVDESIQHLLTQLNERGMLENTIVVFTADHGQEFGDHGLYGHNESLYRGEIQVPLIIWKPGLVPASVRVPTPVSTTDIPATILDLTAPGENNAGTQAAPQALPGRSLEPLWGSGPIVSSWPPPGSELARLHWFDRSAPNYNSPVRSIVTPQWHYIHQLGKDFLFDWKTDPDEMHDLSAGHPTECAAFLAQIQAAEGSGTRTH